MVVGCKGSEKGDTVSLSQRHGLTALRGQVHQQEGRTSWIQGTRFQSDAIPWLQLIQKTIIDNTEKQIERYNPYPHEFAHQGILYITDCHGTFFGPPLSLCLTQNWPWSQSASEGHSMKETIF